ncbi:hypothetical protein SLS59_004332 [Nothophoma quercina]|uniref:Uncharacterized protein n=1 Tax=Nothophoma quercina TaxID=749835 RepID=A0ABR3RFL7_9PLEO
MASSTGVCNIVVFGEPSVGKTCFVDQFCYGKSFVVYDPDNSMSSQKMIIGDQPYHLTLMDLSTSFLKPEQESEYNGWAVKMLAEAEGVVLLYDVTSLESFDYITNQAYKFLRSCRRSECKDEEGTTGEKPTSFGCVLAGNKLDLVESGVRVGAVDQSLAEEWAQTQGMRSIGIDSLGKEGPESALKLLVNNTHMIERLEGRSDGRMKTRRKRKNQEDQFDTGSEKP